MSDRDLRIRVLLNASEKVSGPLKAVREESKKAGDALGETRDRLAKLEKAQADLKGFRELKRGLKDTGEALDTAREKAARLARQISETERPSKELRREFTMAKRDAAELGRKYDEQQRSLQRLRDGLRDAGYSTRNLVADEKRLEGQLRDTNQLLKQQRDHYHEIKKSGAERMARARIEARVDEEIERDRLGRRQRLADRAKATGGLVATAIGAAATASGIEAAKETATYETLLTSIAQKASLARREVEGLGVVFDRWGPALGARPRDMAEGFDSLMANGMDYRAAIASIRPITKASIAYRTPSDVLSNAVFSANKNLGVPASQTTRTLEILSAGDEAGAVGVPALADALPGLSAGYAGLGMRGHRATADLVAGAEIAKLGAGTESEATNNLLNLINKINARETTENFKKFGVDLPAALKKAYRDGKTPLEAIIGLTQQTLKGQPEKLSYLFGDAQVQAAIRPLMQNRNDYLKLRSRVLNNPGAIDRAHQERMTDTSARWDRVSAGWQAREHLVGRKSRPAQNWLLDRLHDAFDPNTRWFGAEVGQNIRLRAAARRSGSRPQDGAPDRGQTIRQRVVTREGDEMRAAQARVAAREKVYSEELIKARAHEEQMYQQKIAFWKRQAADPGWRGIGANMILGIEAGMNQRVPTLRSRILTISASIKAWWKAQWQIKSPSRVFAGYGRYMMEGLAVGLDAAAPHPIQSLRRTAGRVATISAALAAPQISRAEAQALAPRAAINNHPAKAREIAAAVAPALSLAPQRSATTAGTPLTIGNIEIHVHQQPGEDAGALARRVREEFDRIRRENDATRRSSFRDDD